MDRSPPTLAALAADLAAGRTTASALTAACVDRIADLAGEGVRAFIKVYSEAAAQAAIESDRRWAERRPLGPLDGIPISVKDLFDVAGETTTAGSRALADAPP